MRDVPTPRNITIAVIHSVMSNRRGAVSVPGHSVTATAATIATPESAAIAARPSKVAITLRTAYAGTCDRGPVTVSATGSSYHWRYQAPNASACGATTVATALHGRRR